MKKRPTPREPGVFELTTESLAGRANAAAVDALYHDWPDQCASDGLRFMAKDDLSAWMDVVFKKNAAKKDRERGTTSRPWGPTPLEWQRDRDVPDVDPTSALKQQQQQQATTNDAADDDDDDEDDTVVVPGDARVVRCRVCGEKFDIFYNADVSEWVLAGAVKVNADDGTEVVVHRGCRDTTCGKSGTLEADALMPATPRAAFDDDDDDDDDDDEADDDVDVDRDALLAAARAKLDALQASLGESEPLSLEDLEAKEPEIYAQLMEEAESDLKQQLKDAPPPADDGGADDDAPPEPSPDPEPPAEPEPEPEPQVEPEPEPENSAAAPAPMEEDAADDDAENDAGAADAADDDAAQNDAAPMEEEAG